TIRQRLQIRRGDQAPITVVDTSAVEFTNGNFCAFVGFSRADYQFARYGVFHRLGVSPDGSQVVFEVTDVDDAVTDFPPPPHFLSDEQKGIFAVRSDGTGFCPLRPAPPGAPRPPPPRSSHPAPTAPRSPIPIAVRAARTKMPFRSLRSILPPVSADR